MIYDTIEELFESFLPKFDWRFDIRIPMKGSDCIFDCVAFLYYKCHKKV